MSFQTEKIVRARKPHTCDWCGDEISAGSQYLKGTRSDTSKILDTWRLHLECHEAVRRSMEDADPDDVCSFSRNMPRGIAVQEVGK